MTLIYALMFTLAVSSIYVNGDKDVQEKMIGSSSKVTPCTLDEIKQMSGVQGEMTKKGDEVSQDAQDKADGSVDSMKDCKTQADTQDETNVSELVGKTNADKELDSTKVGGALNRHFVAGDKPKRINTAGDNACNDPNICSGGSTCVNTIESYRCICALGYELKDGTCKDINECQLNARITCPNAACLNLPGSYRCICKSGFVALTKNVCSDINECESGTHKCHIHATCTNEPGSYTCKCNEGYKGDGKTCTIGGEWDEWSAWTQCTKTSTQGHKYRHRTCTRTDLVGCSGPTSETINC